MVNRSNYLLKGIPDFVPNTADYLSFWKEQHNKVLNGMWSNGYWIPGILYFYINFWNIEIKDSKNSKNARIALPTFRDIDFDFCLAYCEARGFSRFEKQTLEEVASKSPREIMTQQYPSDMGKPLFENQAKNIILVGSRGFGKSFITANAIGYEFLFERIRGEKNQIVVGASDTKYSSDLLKKVKLGLEHLPGQIEFNNVLYPPPFSKKYRGSLESGKSLEARYEAYVGRTKVIKGNGSSIKHISFQNSPLAANGTRPCLLVFEEAGIFPNLTSSWDSSVETVRYGMNQFGTMMALGTGGDMKAGSVDLSKMFYDTKTYNLVEFEDIWEQKGKIGMFVPATRGLNEFKDADGNSLEEEALTTLTSYRDKLIRSGAAKQTYEQEVQYRPLKPSEAFLISSGNIFPRAELQAHLSEIENREKGFHSGQIGRIEIREDGSIQWVVDQKLRDIKDFPLKNGADTQGAVVIWEHPYIDHTGKPPRGLYVAGTDPYDHDKSETGSLGSTFIYKRFIDFEERCDLLVAEYTARPEFADDYYENVLKLLLYYNAIDLYENERKGMHQYFKAQKCEYLLADQPEYIHDIIKNTTVNRGKGVHMTTQIKDHMEIKVRDWLNTEYAPGRKNLTKIYSIPLLKELITYTDKGNYDRCIAIMMCIMMDANLQKKYRKEKEETTLRDSFFPKKLFANKPNFITIE